MNGAGVGAAIGGVSGGAALEAEEMVFEEESEGV